MAENSAIEWTDDTWNPITGCTLVSEGCRNCYAAQLAATRLKHHPSRAGLARLNADGVAKFTGEVRFNEQWLDQPLRQRKPRMIFVCAHGDLFHENVPDEWIDKVFAVMALAPQHTFQVLTKRPERARDYLTWLPRRFHVASAALSVGRHLPYNHLGWQRKNWKISSFPGSTQPAKWPLPNVWLGTSVEDQATANERIPHLLATPAAVRFISAEPLLGPVDIVKAKTAQNSWDELFDIHWVIVGGESGKGARPMHPDWARSLRDQCAESGVPFFFKQWGEWAPNETQGSDYFQRIGKRAAGRLLDGVEHNAMPQVRP